MSLSNGGSPSLFTNTIAILFDVGSSCCLWFDLQFLLNAMFTTGTIDLQPQPDNCSIVGHSSSFGNFVNSIIRCKEAVNLIKDMSATIAISFVLKTHFICNICVQNI
ncbi:hypothetical protein BB559_007490 [Furculomyces boomerangus]|uniref:Uncharacterized protein n=2 Tax=Harpellales TaxID=61421 RepID=A0A2T9XX54_9FUNG|nr:hypothetical protein BB559_007490 [Furculomyces boomerangus]PWA01907.1 hypothetical protein BB558_001966 [Smittium angustum]